MKARRRALRALARHLAAKVHGVSCLESQRSENWVATLALANEQLVTPSLHVSVARRQDTAPLDVARYLAHLHAMNRRRNEAIRHQSLEILQALNAAGIEPLMLKGILTLLVDRDVDPGERMMADIDLAVPDTKRGDAIAAMASLGYRLRHAFPAGHHAVGEFVRDGDPASVDLHIELVDQTYLLSAAEVWRDAQPASAIGGGSVRFLVPHPTHRALHNIVHAQVHYRGGFYLGELDLRQLLDLRSLVDRHGSVIDWRLIESRLTGFGLATALQSYLHNARRLTGLAWPLGHKPSFLARFHALRCRMQLANPTLRSLAAPWGNLRAVLASHRMAALYGGKSHARLGRLWRHVRSVLGRHSPVFVLERLFRA